MGIERSSWKNPMDGRASKEMSEPGEREMDRGDLKKVSSLLKIGNGFGPDGKALKKVRRGRGKLKTANIRAFLYESSGKSSAANWWKVR